MQLTDFLSAEAIEPDLRARDKPGVLRELAGLLARETAARPEAIERQLVEREALSTTGLGRGVAIPHCKSTGVGHISVCVGLSHPGIDFDSVDEQPARIFFGVVSPPDTGGLHLMVLSRMAALLQDDTFREALLRAGGREAIYRLIEAEDARHQQARQARSAVPPAAP